LPGKGKELQADALKEHIGIKIPVSMVATLDNAWI
jgi:hypothetical protein